MGMRYNDSYRSLESLAVDIGLPGDYLKELTAKGKIPSLKVNGRLKYSPGQVLNALDELADSQTREIKEGGSHAS